jgi:hypothetical protein
VTLIKFSFTKSDYQISCRVSKKCGHGEADYLVFVDGVAVESSKTRARRYDADELPLGSERGLSGSEDRQSFVESLRGRIEDPVRDSR